MTECDHLIGYTELIYEGVVFRYESDAARQHPEEWFKFCPNCGAKLPDPASRPEPLPRPRLEGPPTLCGSVVNESLAILRNNLVFSRVIAKPPEQPTESTS